MACRLATSKRDHAIALYLTGMHRYHLGEELDLAHTELEAVLTLRRELGDRHGEAATRHQLARIDLEQREPAGQ
jgi:hypothetical protein